jgi:hypothetical protein
MPGGTVGVHWVVHAAVAMLQQIVTHLPGRSTIAALSGCGRGLVLINR